MCSDYILYFYYLNNVNEQLHNGQSKSQNKDENMCTESRNYIETVATNTIDIPKVLLSQLHIICKMQLFI